MNNKDVKNKFKIVFNALVDMDFIIENKDD